eukprot:199450-Rhodomonas_salina.1
MYSALSMARASRVPCHDVPLTHMLAMPCLPLLTSTSRFYQGSGRDLPQAVAVTCLRQWP